MEKEEQKIIGVITALFKGADEQDWENVQKVFAAEVLLDYTSLSGGSPAMLSPQEITASWAAFLPGFDKTHHQLSQFQVEMHHDRALVKYFGKADHFLGADEWTVEGNYETELHELAGQWRITKHKFTLFKQSGKLDLPASATERIKKQFNHKR